MKFRLTKKSAGKSLSKFHILNSAGDVVGSVNVPNAEANDLLRHWQGEVGDSLESKNLSARQQPGLRTRLPAVAMSRQGILDG